MNPTWTYLACVDCDVLLGSIPEAEAHAIANTPTENDLDAGADAHDSFYIAKLEGNPS